MARMFGVSDSVHSKIYHADYSITSDEFMKVADEVAKYGYKLVRNEREEEIKQEYQEIIDKKDEEILNLQNTINKLQNKISTQKELIKNYETMDKCATFIYENKQRLRGNNKCNS
jgi:hypothetical protein